MLIAVLIYNFAVIALTAYLVAIHQWSAWWFLGAIMIMFTSKSDKDKQ
jgi:hypothetical protein